MADPVILPSASYRPPSPSLAQRLGRKLNTIMEEDTEDGQHHRQQEQQRAAKPGPMGLVKADNDKHLHPSTNAQIDAWLSPMSDHFPTPRGFHFLAAPIVPSSPSDYSSEDQLTSPDSTNNRLSVMTDVTEFEDLYGVSDDEDRPKRVRSMKASERRKSTTEAATNKTLPPLVIPSSLNNNSTDDASVRSATRKSKLLSPVPPTPPMRVEMSPQVISSMQARQAQETPTISAPPSLDGSMDGSLTSEQLAQMSAPPTPVVGNEDNDENDDSWSGVVQLQPGALATLQALAGDSSSVDEEHEQPQQVIEIPQEPVREMRQQGLRIFTNVQIQPPRPTETTPASQRHSLADLTKLEIPSPGGFFSGLSPRTRNTWHMHAMSPEDAAPPTSTTAEQFYRCPWNIDASIPSVPAIPDPVPGPLPASQPAARFEVSDSAPESNNFAEAFYRNAFSTPSAPVEQVVEVSEEAELEDDVPTARPVLPAAEPVSPRAQESEEAPTEIVTAYDPEYAGKQQEIALSNFDRTEMWLMAQRAYLKPVDSQDFQGTQELATIPESREEEEVEEKAKVKTPEMTKGKEVENSSPSAKKKTVRFSLDVTTTTTKVPRSLPSKLRKQESAYYRAFQDYVIRAGHLDVFAHRQPRFEALQAQRVSRREFHRNQLLGKYQLSVVPQSAKKRLSANVARGDDVLLDDPEKLRREKEQEAMSQMATPAWHVAATKMLNGGKLITAPVAKRLSRMARMAPGRDGVARDRARILDLGGQSTCDWAWHCALQYPNAKVYTVTTKAIRQLSNSNVRGPPNHRQVAVERLTRLPFADAQFDLVSARELHSILKLVGKNGEDEWEGCLRECMRVLKPGGYLDFSLLDSDIVNAGPHGLAKSVEFGFALKTLGYDPCPTKMWLGRLARAGFDDVRRAWMCLPMGEQRRANEKPLPALPSTTSTTPTVNPDTEAQGQDLPHTLTLDAMVTGSTDAAASVTGVVGGWSWERWLLRCEMEKVAGELRLTDTVTAGSAMREAGKCLEGVSAIVEEGRSCGAAWRMLNGYARKPKVTAGAAADSGTGFIPMKIAV